MSIDLTQKITCNGQPVEVLTGWVKVPSYENVCLVRLGIELRVMWENGDVCHVGGTEATATNTAPEPNLVGRGDTVVHMHYTCPFVVVEVRDEWIWGEWTKDGGMCTFKWRECNLVGRPIERVKP